MRRATAVRRVGLVLLAANLVLVLAKGVVFFGTDSLSVGSEAVNSLGDTIYSFVIVAGLYVTTQPPDFEHPHGHERIEPFVSLFVAAGIFVAGGLVLWQALRTLLVGETTVSRGPAAVGVLLGGAIVKYGLYQYCLRISEQHNSPALRATAIDNRNDILSALAALVGVLGAVAGFPVLDPIAASVVAVFILYGGVEIVRDNVDYLVGAAPSEELRRDILERALSHPDVEGAHDVVAHYVGPEIDVSLHIEVEGDRTLLEAHEIETTVMESIEAIPEVDDVFIHVDPREAGEWERDETVEQLVGQQTEQSNAANTPPDTTRPDEK